MNISGMCRDQTGDADKQKKNTSYSLIVYYSVDLEYQGTEYDPASCVCGGE